MHFLTHDNSLVQKISMKNAQLLEFFPYNRFFTQIKGNPHFCLGQKRDKNYTLDNNCGAF